MPEDGLRGLHLPPEVGIWPLAPGWWGLILLLLAALLFRLWRRRGRLALRLAARREFAAIVTAYRREGDAGMLLSRLSILLRRAALAAAPRRRVAGLGGEDWLKELDRLGGTGSAFAKGAGRALLEAPYGGQPPADPEALIALARRWLRSVP